MKRGKLILIFIVLFISLVLFKQFEVSFKDFKGEAAYGSYSVSLTIVDLNNYNVTYTKFNGSTTNINLLQRIQQENISSLTLENPNYGKIIYNEIINISSNISIDYALDIAYNKIELNSSNLTRFNTSATLYLYNLTFSNPRILKDGELCPSNICVKNSYSGGTLSFNVTHFTFYSAEETPGVETPSVITTTGIGGAGGGALGASKIIHIPGKFFDLLINIPEKYRKLMPGDLLVSEFEIISFKDKPANITVEYRIEDDNKNIIAKKLETKFIERRLGYITNLQLPLEIKPGLYLLCGEVKEDTTLACHSFEVVETIFVEKPQSIMFANENYMLILFSGIFIILLVILILLLIIYSKYRKLVPEFNLKKVYGKRMKLPNYIFIFFCIILLSYFVGMSLDNLSGKVVKPITNDEEPIFETNLFLEKGEIMTGENLIVTTKILNTEVGKTKDILVKYTVWDKDKKIKISEISETLAIQTTISLVRHINIPKDIKEGEYILSVEVYKDSLRGIASTTFRVNESGFLSSFEHILIYGLLAISFLILFIIVILINSIIKMNSLRKNKSRI